MINLSKETEDLAKRLADAQHLSVEEAVRLAIEDKARVKGIAPKVRAAKDQSPEAIAARSANIDRLVAEIAAMPVLDPRSPREIMEDLNEL